MDVDSSKSFLKQNKNSKLTTCCCINNPKEYNGDE